MELKNIENIFLNVLLRVSTLGVFIVMISNILLFPKDTHPIFVAGIIFLACAFAYFIRLSYPTVAVVVLTSIVLLAMIYQRLDLPNATTSLAIVLVVGFIVSIMLKGRVMWTMHGIAFAILNTVFILHAESIITASVTYSTLYGILAYATWMLKFNYDKMTHQLSEANIELQDKSNEIVAQNEELLQIQDMLNGANITLEKTVNERTAKIQAQNEILVRYSYTNAHHLRGPVARLLGLISICRLETNPDFNFFMNKIWDQANEIDGVIRQINSELDTR